MIHLSKGFAIASRLVKRKYAAKGCVKNRKVIFLIEKYDLNWKNNKLGRGGTDGLPSFIFRASENPLPFLFNDGRLIIC